MNKKIIPLIIVAIVASGFAYYTYRTSKAETNDTTLYGNVDIRETSLAFRVGGRVEKVLVDEGSTVKAGDILAVLDTAPLMNTLRGVEATYAALNARTAMMHNGYRAEDISQAKAKLQSSRVALAEAERQYHRQADLVKTGAATQQTLDTSQANRDQLAAQLTVAEKQVQLMTSGFRKEEIDEAEAHLSQAQANLDAAKLALQDATLLSPSDGIILTRTVEQGSMVQAGATAFSLSLTKPVWVRAYVSEPLLGHYASGKKVELTTDTQGGHPYHGTIGFVSPTAEFTPKTVETTDLRTSLVYRLRIVVDDADSQLRQGMPVTIKLAK